MSSDPLLPIAPARVKALLLPLGRIKADKFASYVTRLHSENVVPLRDITPDGRPNRNMFSPLAFPDGAMLYDLINHVPPPSQLALSPFDLYREPMAIIAVADGQEMEDVTFSKRHSANGTGPTVLERNMRALYQELEDLRDEYHKALVHQVLVFDYDPPDDKDIPLPEEGIVTIPPLEDCKRTTLKTVMCNISARLLAEMTAQAKSYEAMTSIESPVHHAPSRPTNGMPGEEGVNGLSRRNSQFSLPTANGRSHSASGLAEKSHARMSMPPVPSRPTVSSSHSTPLRPSTPVKTGLSNPPVNADDIPSETGSGPASPEQKISRPDTAEGIMESTKDRVAVQGFGPGGANDRWRLKGKGRSSIVIGSMYLQAGRWSDSLKELSEGATAARSLNDHIWHGKALELILVNLFLLGWSGLEFQVPTACLAAQEGSSRVSWNKSEPQAPATDQPKHLRNLQAILPELIDRILNLYSRKRAESEKLPALPFSEATIRLSKVLAALHMAGGELNKDALNIIVTGSLPEKRLTTSPRLTIQPTRQHIVNLLFDAFPASHSFELLTTADRASILSGIASVLATLGFQRKKAMVIRELVSVLISGLVEARTRGAADAGIHPAAGLIPITQGADGRTAGVGLDLTEGDIEQGIEAFLHLLCRSYGVVGYNGAESLPPSSTRDVNEPDEAILARIYKQSSARFFGFPSIKLNILRACINFSEALPDFNGVLKYSSDLLRTSGSGIAPGPRKEDVSPTIYDEEQARLTTNIARTHALVQHLGLPELAAEYWDEFLVRGLKLDPLPVNRAPVPHARSVLPGAAAGRQSQDVNPFIYNPFLKKPDEVVAQYLVAEEPAFFRITLQNPYDIEVDIDSVRLETTGVDFDAVPETTRLGPNRTQSLKLRGSPKERGQLKVTGAIVQVRGCHPKRFPIFSTPWVPSLPTKIKAKGIEALEQSDALTKPASPSLQADVLDLTVIQSQPLLSVKSTTLPQYSVMVLEGERKVFSVTLQNQSSTPVDFMLFSFKDSTQAPLQTALDNREATPAELYEYEIILMKKQALRLPHGTQTRHIAAGGEETFDFEILGKPGLTEATIQVDYTHLGVPRDEVKEQFYTRQVSIDLMVTVNASVELTRADALPLFGEIPPALYDRLGAGGSQRYDDYCLLSMDLRNAWPSQMLVHIEGEDGMGVDESILPGNTNRVVMPIKRAFVDDPHAPIPSLNPSRERQFVVSTTKIPPELERANREIFWYREKLLEQLRITWKTTTAPRRNGVVELRNLRLTSRLVETIKIDEVGIDISLASEVESKGDGANAVYVDEYMQVKVQITNRTTKPILPLVRLMPSLCHRSLHVALDYTRKLGWDGTLQQLLPQLQGKSSAEVVLGMTALCRGEFEMTATVEEVQVWEDPEAKKKSQAETRSRSDTQTMLEAALGAKDRRMWHSRQPFFVLARDRE